jgi:hypothetical protein
MVNSKAWYESKTIWISIGTIAAGTIQLIIGQNLLSGAALASLGYIYMILRLVTTTPVNVNGTTTNTIPVS